LRIFSFRDDLLSEALIGEQVAIEQEIVSRGGAGCAHDAAYMQSGVPGLHPVSASAMLEAPITKSVDHDPVEPYSIGFGTELVYFVLCFCFEI